MYRELLAFLIVFLAAVSYGIDATVMRYSGVTDPIILAGIRVCATAIFLMLTLWRFPKFRKIVVSAEGRVAVEGEYLRLVS